MHRSKQFSALEHIYAGVIAYSCFFRLCSYNKALFDRSEKELKLWGFQYFSELPHALSMVVLKDDIISLQRNDRHLLGFCILNTH